ncbi:MAG: adenylate kinase [Deltaproteobacteria bacterium RIFCSPLOWO2_12_FULL_40_28]|nr:MAG: adenylate kinase [Deltaproteobacteria bacterium RIFCSPHIGHO2_02_FULL_40_28]OGQ18988.1 MAG: adenylate kinase [Deltaproteobacteria bacterium RIFCSPHIGHO2_12_FULL_40_32]OGQ39531.1 MAG: adenylate kinase [Deltaproteobacteria bacterium RIFCSPLOWO2_02_FULL_40_36]OGQ53421.1 MAG: adenylate kinase [Deltaproteobacteria bacterium RIFCSPLOWO2_12_FULL_40_28]
MNLILLGPPGCGKGTQSVLLRNKLKVPAISTGQMLREACAEGTEQGLKAEKYLSSGSLVPDDIVIAIVKKRLSLGDCRDGYILDGFPRTLNQADVLKEWLGHQGKQVNVVLNFELTEKELVRRLTGRRECRICGAGYHVEQAPEKCDRCGGDLYQRDDDKEETIRRRLHIYKEQTAPLISYYTKESVLKNIDGLGDKTAIFDRIEKALNGVSVN